jgi:ATPases with chaperone activity, ATP-binding subunit
VRAHIEQILGRGEKLTETPQMLFTPRTRKVLEQSAREAADLHQEMISTEHILLALMREREGVAAHILVKMGVDLDKARRDLVAILSGGKTPMLPNPNPRLPRLTAIPQT